MKNRSENSAGRGQILSVLPVNSCSIDQKSGEICTGQADLQPISFKSDRLLGRRREQVGMNQPFPKDTCMVSLPFGDWRSAKTCRLSKVIGNDK